LISVKKIFSTLLFTLTAAIAFGQAGDSIIVQAMKDELARNMKELRYEGFEHPFYIAYSIDDTRSYGIVGMMGSLLRSTADHSRIKNVRVLVGDYGFNDESLDNNSYSPPEPNEIDLPLDDDYYGIRRSLWVTTDYIYKGAARQYKKNLELLDEKKKTVAEMPHRSFARKPVARIVTTVPPLKPDIAALENYIRDLSAEFRKYPSIDHSSVYISFTDGYKYFVNSEGTVSMTPVRRASLHVFGQRKTPEGETIQEQIVQDAFTPAELPSADQMKEEIRRLCTFITAEPRKRFEDEYSGPVLITGRAVADLFARTLFNSKDALIASNTLPDPRGYRTSDQTSIDTKIGKAIVPATITVRSVPLLKTFAGTPLLGSSEVDDEGVVAEAETILIEKGVLKNLLNDRSLIKEAESPNGHASGPGVIDVSVDNGIGMEALKAMLIGEAKRQGHEYAIIFSEDPATAGGPYALRIWVADGKEEMFRAPLFEFIDLKDLKDILGAAINRRAYNIPSGPDQLASFIVPEAILIRDLEVKGASTTFFKDEQFISSPLNK
jgi:hypothetical protein